MNPNDWIIANVKHSGYYRVNYDKENWILLANQLKEDFTLIDPVNRASLIDDSFNLGKAGFLEQTQFLSIISYLDKETDAMAFEAAFNGIYYLNNMLNTDYFLHKKYQVSTFFLIFLILKFKLESKFN